MVNRVRTGPLELQERFGTCSLSFPRGGPDMTAFLSDAVRCFWCGEDAGGGTYAFHWGFSKGEHPGSHNSYRLGQGLRWRRAADGSIPGWTTFNDLKVSSAKIGDPAVRDLIVLAGPMIQWGTWDECQVCKARYGWVPVTIRDGVVAHAASTLPCEMFSLEVTEFTLEPDGRWLRRPEWSDRTYQQHLAMGGEIVE